MNEIATYGKKYSSYLTEYELLIDIPHQKGNLKAGDIGRGHKMDMVRIDGTIPVWFKKHEREFYWYPVWILPEHLKSTQ